MHEFGLVLTIAIVAIVFGRRAFRTWVRAKHGYPLDEAREWRSRRGAYDGGPDDQRRIALLSTENERLTGQVGRLEERIAVLERIATDPGVRTAAEIEALRDR